MGVVPTGPQDIERTRTLWFALLLTTSHIKPGRVDRFLPHPLRWTMAVQATALIALFTSGAVAGSAATRPLDCLQ